VNVPRKPPRKNPELPSAAEAEPGAAVPCETVDPMSMPEDPESDEPARGKTRSAPAPGVPISAEEYERLKEKAKHSPPRPAGHAQEDQPKKK